LQWVRSLFSNQVSCACVGCRHLAVLTLCQGNEQAASLLLLEAMGCVFYLFFALFPNRSWRPHLRRAFIQSSAFQGPLSSYRSQLVLFQLNKPK
jgi:hypothetical protein